MKDQQVAHRGRGWAGKTQFCKPKMWLMPMCPRESSGFLREFLSWSHSRECSSKLKFFSLPLDFKHELKRRQSSHQSWIASSTSSAWCHTHLNCHSSGHSQKSWLSNPTKAPRAPLSFCTVHPFFWLPDSLTLLNLFSIILGFVPSPKASIHAEFHTQEYNSKQINSQESKPVRCNL